VSSENNSKGTVSLASLPQTEGWIEYTDTTGVVLDRYVVYWHHADIQDMLDISAKAGIVFFGSAAGIPPSTRSPESLPIEAGAFSLS
jgi:hypothetical protein